MGGMQKGYKLCAGHRICSCQNNYFGITEGSLRLKSALLCTSHNETYINISRLTKYC